MKGAGVIGVADHACGQGQALALYEGGLARQAIDLRDFVPKAAIAIKASGEALESVALAHNITTSARSLLIAIDRIIALVKVGLGFPHSGAIAERAQCARGCRRRALRNRGLIVHIRGAEAGYMTVLIHIMSPYY